MSEPPGPSRESLPAYAWLGLGILVGSQLALALGVSGLAVWWTPIQWTAFILLADGIVFALAGSSWLKSGRREFPLLALLSVGIWLIFEAYNLHLRNWYYVGVPQNPWLRNFGYFWSFATILPGIFEMTDLVGTLSGRRRPSAPSKGKPVGVSFGILWVLGLIMLGLPLAVPSHVAAYLFGLVWLGFIFVLDPINARLGAPSLLARWRAGDRVPLLALLLGGFICGLLWEAWNLQAYRAAGAYWVYTIPQPLRIFGWRFGQMPVLGLLGFPPFACEMFAWYYLLRRVIRLDRVLAGPGRR